MSKTHLLTNISRPGLTLKVGSVRITTPVLSRLSQKVIEYSLGTFFPKSIQPYLKKRPIVSPEGHTLWQLTILSSSQLWQNLVFCLCSKMALFHTKNKIYFSKLVWLFLISLSLWNYYLTKCSWFKLINVFDIQKGSLSTWLLGTR